MRKRSFAAITDENTRVLILGSLPGEISLARAQYYAHPQNQFWRLTGAVIGSDLTGLPYPERLAALRSAGIGLWDVIGSASREGSLDTAIRDHEANALAELASSLPDLRAIAFNGGKASAIGRKRLGGDGAAEFVDLPSSSPAYTLSFDRKAAQWMRLQAFLEG